MPTVLIKAAWSGCQTEEIIDEVFIDDDEWAAMTQEEKDKDAWDAFIDYLSPSAWMEVKE